MRVIIIGAGFSGCQLAMELYRQGRRGLEILLVERGGQFGPGRAYGAGEPDFLLNTRSALLGIHEDDPGHFCRWLGRHQPAFASPDSFAPRRVYGAYLRAMIEMAARTEAGGVRIERVTGEAAQLVETSGGILLGLTDGRRFVGDHAVICTGMSKPRLPAVPGLAHASHARIIDDPWDETRLARIGRQDSVLILGTGLTMVDTALFLESRGHEGSILALSRHGLMPLTHRPAGAAAARPHVPLLDFSGDAPLTMRRLMQSVRREVARATAQGVDWRAVVDGLRPSIETIWRHLPIAERRRFLRHARSFWEIHRHRMAPAVARAIARPIRSGRLAIEAGRILAVEPDETGIRAVLRRRGAAEPTTVAADWLVSCTGLRGPAQSADPLIRHLLASGRARLDPLGLGLDVTSTQHVVSHDGWPSARLFAHGPLLRGTAWEVTAVPEIRARGHALARLILQESIERNRPDGRFDQGRLGAVSGLDKAY